MTLSCAVRSDRQESAAELPRLAATHCQWQPEWSGDSEGPALRFPAHCRLRLASRISGSITYGSDGTIQRQLTGKPEFWPRAPPSNYDHSNCHANELKEMPCRESAAKEHEAHWQLGALPVALANRCSCA